MAKTVRRLQDVLYHQFPRTGRAAATKRKRAAGFRLPLPVIPSRSPSSTRGRVGGRQRGRFRPQGAREELVDLALEGRVFGITFSAALMRLTRGMLLEHAETLQAATGGTAPRPPQVDRPVGDVCRPGTVGGS